MNSNTESGPPRHDGLSIFEIIGSSTNPVPTRPLENTPSPSSTSASAASQPSTASSPQTFHLFPELPLEIRRMIWNFALPIHFIPIRTIELSNTSKVPIEGTKSVRRTKTSVALLTEPEELLDSVAQLVADFDGDIGASADAEARGKALNELLEKRVFRRTYDDLNLVNWDVLSTTIISRLSASSQHASSSYQRYLANQAYRDGLRLVCRESYAELSRGMESALVCNFAPDAVIFNDVHKSVTRMTGIPGAGRASTQHSAEFFFPSSSDPTLSIKPTAYFARDLEQRKGRLLAPGIRFYPEKSTILFQGTLNTFFESCLSCPTPSTGSSTDRAPAYSTTYSNIRYLAVEQDPRDLMNVNYAPRSYGARLDGLEELVFILEREQVGKVDRKWDGLEWVVDRKGAQEQERLEERTKMMVGGWGYGVPRRCRVVVAREFWGM